MVFLTSPVKDVERVGSEQVVEGKQGSQDSKIEGSRASGVFHCWVIHPAIPITLTPIKMINY